MENKPQLDAARGRCDTVGRPAGPLVNPLNETYMSIYTANGYDSRKDYLMKLAEEYNVPFRDVVAAAYLLGPDEDFDALVSTLQDYSNIISN